MSLSLHQVETQGREIVDEACGFPDTGESQVAAFSYCSFLGHRYAGRKLHNQYINMIQ